MTFYLLVGTGSITICLSFWFLPGTDAVVVTVLQPYTARNDDELTVNVNDEVTVIHKREGGWWRGRLGDKEGLFPSSCVVRPDKQEEQLVRAK